MADARVTLDGNLTADPELKFSNSGKAIANLSVAVQHRSQSEDKPTSFFNVVAWGELGEHTAKSLTKGDRVVVTGQLRQRSWEAKDGTKRSAVEVWADEVSPSLRFSDVKLGGDDNKPSNQNQNRGGNRNTSRTTTDNSPDYDYEEPF